MKASSAGMWTQSVYEAGYHQMVHDYKPYDIRLDPGFHGNSFEGNRLPNNLPSWRPCEWPDQFIAKSDEPSSKMAGNSSTQTTVINGVPSNFQEVEVKSEVLDESYFKWQNQQFLPPQNPPDVGRMGRFYANVKNATITSPQWRSCGQLPEAQDLRTGARNMIVQQAESNLAPSSFQSMTSLDLSHCTSADPMDMVGNMSSFTETPPPTPPYTPQHSTSSTSSIPTFVDDVQGKTYTMLETPRDKVLPSFGDDMEMTKSDMSSWERVHPMNWTPDEVMDFIFWLAMYTTDGIPDIKAGRFRNSTGLDLMQMTAQDFQEVSEEYGEQFYNKFQMLLQQAEFQYSPNFTEDDMGYCSPQDPYLSSPADKPMEDELSLTRVRIQGHEYDYDRQDIFNGFPVCSTDHQVEDPGYMSGDSTGSGSCYSQDSQQIPIVQPNVYEPPMMSPRPYPSMPPQPSLVKKRGPGRPRKIQADGQPRPPCQRGRKPGQTTKGNHLYEFILQLLKDRNANPTLVKWEDRENGVFRFVQSEKVAKLWGKKKNNQKMTYEKLSRAMRFCRSVGYFAQLPRDRGFPKKLCFKFGEKAQNWQTCDV